MSKAQDRSMTEGPKSARTKPPIPTQLSAGVPDRVLWVPHSPPRDEPTKYVMATQGQLLG